MKQSHHNKYKRDNKKTRSRVRSSEAPDEFINVAVLTGDPLMCAQDKKLYADEYDMSPYGEEQLVEVFQLVKMHLFNNMPCKFSIIQGPHEQVQLFADVQPLKSSNVSMPGIERLSNPTSGSGSSVAKKQSHLKQATTSPPPKLF